VRREDIKAGLRVYDSRNTPDITYTWITGGRFIDGRLVYSACDNCGDIDQFMLREDQVVLPDIPIVLTAKCRREPTILGTFCIQCAGLDDLEPIVQLVK
jgi:hypothetical protein